MDRPTLLMVGRGEPMDAALRLALDRYGLFVEAVDAENLRRSVQLTAPDLILLLGDAAAQGGAEALKVLAGDPSSAAVPVVLLAPDTGLESRMHAFRHGAMAVVPRSASPDAIARKVAGLTKELSEHFEERTGEIGEATFDELVELVKKELRSGILSVHAPNHKGGPMRLVLGAGRPVADAVQEFVARLKPHVTAADAMYYQFHTSAGGPVGLLDIEGASAESESLDALRILLVDDDPARADTLAQELRARGAMVFVTDNTGRGIERAVGLDPQVVILDAAGLEGPGFEVVRRIRKDLRLRWASILVAPWDEIWPNGDAMPDVGKLASRMEPLLVPERELAERAQQKEPFDVRLESTGPGRMLRVLVASGETLHLTIRNPKAVVEVDLAQGLLVGATARTSDGQTEEGTAALAILLSLGSARVHVERRANPAVANVMSPVDEALSIASIERSQATSARPPEPTEKKGEPSSPLDAGDLRWDGSSPSEHPSLADELPSEPTRIKNLEGLAKAGEALLKTVAPPPTETELPEVAPELELEPTLPPPAPAGAPTPTKPRAIPPPAKPLAPPPAPLSPLRAESSPKKRPRRPTLTMGSPLAPMPVAKPKPPPKAEPQPAPEPPPAPESAPAELSQDEIPTLEAMPAVEPPPETVLSPVPPPASSEGPTATEPPEPKNAKSAPRARSRGRSLAIAAVVLASLTLTAVLGLIAYRHSGLQDPRLDGLLVALGAPPERIEAASTTEEAPRLPAQPRDQQEERAASPSTEESAEIEIEEEPTEEGARDDATVLAQSEVAEEQPEGSLEEAQDERAAAEAQPAESDTETLAQSDISEPAAESHDEEEPPEGTRADELLRAARRAGKTELAERLYRRVLELEPREHHAMIGLAEILMARNAHAEAVPLLRSAVRRRPRRAPYRVLLGDALAGAGDDAAARREWERALELHPNDVRARRRLGR